MVLNKRLPIPLKTSPTPTGHLCLMGGRSSENMMSVVQVSINPDLKGGNRQIIIVDSNGKLLIPLQPLRNFSKK